MVESTFPMEQMKGCSIKKLCTSSFVFSHQTVFTHNRNTRYITNTIYADGYS